MKIVGIELHEYAGSGRFVVLVLPHADSCAVGLLGQETAGLDKVSYAKSDDVKSVPDRRLSARLGAANAEALCAVVRALRFLLDF